MANKKHNSGQWFDFARDSYFERTSRPIYAIVFLLPFLFFYELGTILINTDVLRQTQVRVVAFVWLQDFLEYLGFGSKLAWMAPPLAVVIILAAMQLTSRKSWRIWFGDIVPMTVECVLLAVPLIVLTLFLNSPARSQGQGAWFDSGRVSVCNEYAVACSSVEDGGSSAATEGGGNVVARRYLLTNIVTGIGAGIYEELVFRLILIGILIMLFQDVLRLSQRNSIIFAVLLSAALFSAHHHIVFLNGRLAQCAEFNWTEFTFRTIAGIYFAILFAIRGFGITVGAHAFYDIIAVFINVYFFGQ